MANPIFSHYMGNCGQFAGYGELTAGIWVIQVKIRPSALMKQVSKSNKGMLMIYYFDDFFFWPLQVCIPIGSMYGIYANIRGILMVNVTVYSSTMDPMGYIKTLKSKYPLVN